MADFRSSFPKHLSIILMAVIGCTLALSSQLISENGRCEPITIPMCQKLPYNTTFFPNLMGHETQTEASVEIQQFSPLIRVNCSPELRNFLCSLYAPVCVTMNKKPHRLVPCRHNCKKVRKGCIKVLKTYGFKWPRSMRCTKYPKKNDKNLCVDWSPKTGAKGDRKNGRRKGKKLRKKNKKNLRKKQKNQRTGVGIDSTLDGVITSPKVTPFRKEKRNKGRKKTKRRKKNKRGRKQKKMKRGKKKKSFGSSAAKEDRKSG